MKRWFSVIGLFVLAACGGSDEGASVAADSAGIDEAPDGQFVIEDSSVIIGPGADIDDDDVNDVAPPDTADTASSERPCTSNDHCVTDSPCVVSACGVDGFCADTPLVGKPCDDGSVCTSGEACDESGLCSGGESILGEAQPCLVCTCDPVSGSSCEPAVPGSACDDGDCCTENDLCVVCDGADADCQSHGRACRGAAPTCNDADPCTTDSCVCEAGVAGCAHGSAPDGAACSSDGTLCTEPGSCQGGTCAPGPALPLDDGNPCTQDLCVKGVIEHKPLTQGQCDDGIECTTDDHCSLGTCVGGPPVTCLVPECAGSASCVPGQGCVPVWLPSGAVCEGESPCASAFACNEEHQCVPTVGKICDDGNACTVDGCDPVTGACTTAPTAIDCSVPAPCRLAQCNPATGACDAVAPNGTPCDGGTCNDGACTCAPSCNGKECGDDGCGGSCGGCTAGATCTDGQCDCVPSCDGNECGDDGCGGSCGSCLDGTTCTDGQCLGCDDTCPTLCLPDGRCCPPGGFCPKTDTTLSGAQSYDVVYIPAGVTVRCVGSAPLELAVSGDVIIDGALRADGAGGAATSSPERFKGTCGGYDGGDGFRDCTSSATTFCETTPASTASCLALLSPKETYSGSACAYLSSAPGEPGYGPGGGFGGPEANPLHNAAPGNAPGGGGGSFITSGQKGQDGVTQCKTLVGGKAGPVVGGNTPQGGSGGGGGGMARNGACAAACPLGCTAWGGDGGAGGGVIKLQASGTVTVNGVVSARGGNGAAGGGAVCFAGGGGGSGGSVVITAPTVTTPSAKSNHLIVNGGDGGAASTQCPTAGAGGAGGAGLLIAP
ncbi:MAG: hypothetical protein IV100_30600 [Myxococcales bacterium]|nr:hypothetical protein [Myxococcales bacterium]